MSKLPPCDHDECPPTRCLHAPELGAQAGSLPISMTGIQRLNRALLGTLMKPETASIVADRLEELEREIDDVKRKWRSDQRYMAVARQQGKRAIGIELRETQCAEIARRLSQGELFSPPNDRISDRADNAAGA